MPGTIEQKVAQSLVEAANPLDFIKSNLKPSNPVPDNFIAKPPPKPTFTEEPIVEVPPVQAQVPPEGEIKIETPPAPEAAKEEPVKAAPNEVPPLTESPKTAGEELLSGVKEKGPKESLKDLRKKTNELATELAAKEAAILEAQNKIKAFETGEAIPEALKKEREKVSHLEKYQQLYDFRSSREYQEKYVQPLQVLEEDANKLVNDYQVEPEVFTAALGIENKRELNNYLKDHFDDVGALEVKELITKIKDVQTRAAEAELVPKQELQRLQAERKEREERQSEQRINVISRSAQDGWVDAISEIHQEGLYPELTYKDNDEKHNAVVKPIIEEASKEFGKFITLLGHLGIKELPKDVAKGLAKRFQLSQGSPVMALSRANHYKNAQEIKDNAKRDAYYMRPPVGSGGNGMPASMNVPTGPTSPAEAADVLLQQTMAKRRR